MFILQLLVYENKNAQTKRYYLDDETKKTNHIHHGTITETINNLSFTFEIIQKSPFLAIFNNL